MKKLFLAVSLISTVAFSLNALATCKPRADIVRACYAYSSYPNVVDACSVSSQLVREQTRGVYHCEVRGWQCSLVSEWYGDSHGGGDFRVCTSQRNSYDPRECLKNSYCEWSW